VPLIISVPGKKPGVCHSLVELLDLYPTTARLCGLEVPARLQGRDISVILDDPKATVHDTVFSVAGSSKGLMLRDDRWVFIQYGEDAKGGIELFDMQNDPRQINNLAGSLDHVSRLADWKERIAAKLKAVRTNDLKP
jgi:iduronate 2-sulfatase